ncbi:MAG: hypothetical protein DCC67_18490, partial [Planctomycetota bacterium]
MLLEHEIAPCSRQCAVTGRPFGRGEVYFSELRIDHGVVLRRDFSAANWAGPSDGGIAWWRSRTPELDAARPKLAPQDVLLNLFAELDSQPLEAEFRYLLGLLLIRRRLVKLEETRCDASGQVLLLDCPRRNEQFELRVVEPA